MAGQRNKKCFYISSSIIETITKHILDVNTVVWDGLEVVLMWFVVVWRWFGVVWGVSTDPE